ncbi:type VI secretion system protein TssA [Xenorhabdus siamensis]|uniref:type VI secretion system protein TssA n=1 Tax=Xenorhabdus siamensis TaxID=3136254 RepID=UPI0030F4416F
MNIEALLAPISEESPCGENLEYDDVFLLLEQSIIGKAEQQFGDFVIPAEPPDWLEVEKQATTLLLSRTKDLRIIIALMHAWVETQGICGYAAGLTLLRQTLEHYWEEVWPRLEFDGEYDPLFRLNALADIEDGAPLSIKVQYSILLKSISQELSFREVCSLLDGSITEISGYTGGRTRLQDELKQQTDSPEISALAIIRDQVTALLDIIRQHLSAGHMPELSRFLRNLNTVIEFSALSGPATATSITPDNKGEPKSASVIKQATTRSSIDPSSIEQSSTDTAVPAGLSSLNWYGVEINNRDEARMLLEKAKTYFLTHEPSHPAPMMIDRIQRLIDRDFIDIIYDLAPEGLNQLAIIFGHTDNSDTDTN